MKEEAKKYIIIRSTRYPSFGNERYLMYIEVIGTKEQAINLAKILCSPGQEYEYYVDGLDY